MATNNYLQIGDIVLPPAARMTLTTMPFYYEHVSMNGIVSRDLRQIESTSIISIAWEALTPAEESATAAAWEALVNSMSVFTFYTGVVSGLYQAVLDDKSNEYNATGYSGIKEGAGLMVLFDVTMVLRAVALIEGG